MTAKKAKEKKPKAKKKEFTLQPAILGALRRLFRRYPEYIAVKNENKREYFVKSKKGKPMRRVGYICNICGELSPNTSTTVDHIECVVDIKDGFIDLNTYAKRLFCPKSNLQCLCARCNKEKCKREAAERAKYRREKNPPVPKASKPKKAPTTKRKKK